MAISGARELASEIYSYWLENGQDRPLSVCVPGGTCTTALLLHHELNKLRQRPNKSLGSDEYDEPMDIRVVVIPCVGSSAYARRQMMSLSASIGASTDDIPTILAPAPDDWLNQAGSDPATFKYFSFGEPDKKILETYETMQGDHNMVLDLLYGSPAWAILLRHWKTHPSADVPYDPYNPLAGREIMYVHSGGVEGINSQLLRYKYKGLIAIEDVQLPGRNN
jgi:1-aminocyclopropane-1-carboxylate deaminase/D-cysteine desulfhydrase-like pyridoxal-dependent ACC family enzyme